MKRMLLLVTCIFWMSSHAAAAGAAVSMATAASPAADFTGMWKGTGEALDSSGWDAPCTMEFEIKHTATELVVQAGGWKCQPLTETIWKPVTLKIVGNELIYEKPESRHAGQPIGVIGEDGIHIAYDRPDGITVIYQVTRQADGSFRYYQTYENTAGFLTVVGAIRLQR